jgi:hypothetical protein
MPRGDGTGPGGMGPMTGRAAGYCAGYSAPGFANPVSGRGFGYGGGMGRGMGRGRGLGGGRGFRGGMGAGNPAYQAVPAYPVAPPQIAPEDEAQMIESDIKYLQDDLKAMEKRLSELTPKKK